MVSQEIGVDVMSTEQLNQGTELKEKVAALQQALLDKHPSMPQLLQQIYVNLRANPENVTLLEETEIKAIVNGLEKQTMTELATTVAKKSTSATKTLKAKLSGGNVDDLI